MARSTLPLYPTDDGWPYPDQAGLDVFGVPRTDGFVDPIDDDEIDLDRLELVADPHAFADLTALERHVVARRFGFTGAPATMKELRAEMDCSRVELREVLGTAIDKLRTRLR